MSIRNLLTPEVKSYQDINVNKLTCEECVCVSNTIDEIYTQNIYVDPPATEIFINDKLHLLGDLEVDGSIIGNVSDDVLDVNEINQKDNGFIQVNDDTVFTTNSVKLTSVAGQESITANNCFHLQSDGDACVYIQADRDGSGGLDNPLLLANTSGGNYGTVFLMSNTSGQLQIANGNTTDATSGTIQFFTTQITDNGDAPFDFSGSSLLLGLDNNNVNCYRDIDVNNNDIVNVGDLDLQGSLTNSTGDITVNKSIDFQNTFDAYNINNLEVDGIFNYNNAILDNTATDFLVLDGQTVKYRNSLPFGNLQYYDKRYLLTNYTTSFTTFVGTSPFTLTDLPAGDYILHWSCLLGNTQANRYTEARIMQDGSTELVKFGKATTSDASILESCAGQIPITIGVTATTTFEYEFRAESNTALLQKYCMILYQIL